ERTLKARTEFEQEVRRRERDIQQVEQRIVTKEEQLARKLEDIERKLNEQSNRDRNFAGRERQLAEKEGRLSQAVDEQRRKLETIAGLTAEEAKRQLMTQVEVDSRREAALLGMRLEEEA